MCIISVGKPPSSPPGENQSHVETGGKWKYAPTYPWLTIGGGLRMGFVFLYLYLCLCIRFWSANTLLPNCTNPWLTMLMMGLEKHCGVFPFHGVRAGVLPPEHKVVYYLQSGRCRYITTSSQFSLTYISRHLGQFILEMGIKRSV